MTLKEKLMLMYGYDVEDLPDYSDEPIINGELDPHALASQTIKTANEKSSRPNDPLSDE